KHRVIPDEILQLSAEAKPRETTLCLNCRRELETWYTAKVNKLVYDVGTQEFRDRTSSEMIEEYEAALKSFVKYTRERK
ncbi:hypothetical protein ACFLW1_03580, partial [Chloroflexota bacterium]